MFNIKYKLARPDLGDDELAAVKRVFDSGNLVQGEEVARLESLVCDLTGARHAIAVSSGTAALHVCFMAAKLKAGELVFIPSYAWPAAANIALIMGALPVLVDVLPGTYNIDPTSLSERIRFSRAAGLGHPHLVVPVHQFGLSCEIEAIVKIAHENQLTVIEDAACALGAVRGRKAVGCFGAMGIFSLHPRKSVTAGEGGVIITDDDTLAGMARALRDHGRTGDGQFIMPGLNYRLSEMQAAIASVQIAGQSERGAERFKNTIEKRRTIAGWYLEALENCPGLVLPESSADHTWQTFMLTLQSGPSPTDRPDQTVAAIDRSLLIKLLRETYGIETGIGSVDTHTQELFRNQPGWMPLPVSTHLARCGLALPLYPGMSRTDVEFCARTLIGTLIELSESVLD